MRLTDILKDSYGNYFAQQLFFFMSTSIQHTIIIKITNEFIVVSDDPTSLSAITSIISNSKFGKKSQDLLVVFMRKFDMDEYLINFKLIKVLEAMLDSFQDSDVDFIISFVIEKFHQLYKLRPGFFLIRKLIKYCKNLTVQSSIVKKIESCIKSFPYSGNGSLLCQCLIRNFCIVESHQKHPTVVSSLESNIHKMTNFRSNYKSKVKVQPEEQLEDGENEEMSQSLSETARNTALSAFFDLLICKVLPFDLNKHTSKVLECALKYGGNEFQDKFAQAFLSQSTTDNANSNYKHTSNEGTKHLKYLLSTERGKKFIRSAFDFMKPQNKRILEDMVSKLESKQLTKHQSKKALETKNDKINPCSENKYYTKSNIYKTKVNSVNQSIEKEKDNVEPRSCKQINSRGYHLGVKSHVVIPNTEVEAIKNKNANQKYGNLKALLK